MVNIRLFCDECNRTDGEFILSKSGDADCDKQININTHNAFAAIDIAMKSEIPKMLAQDGWIVTATSIKCPKCKFNG